MLLACCEKNSAVLLEKWLKGCCVLLIHLDLLLAFVVYRSISF